MHTAQRVQGIVVADLTGGRILGLQCKALILADGGASDLAQTGRGGHGLALALEADIPLRDMEFLASTPLGVRDTAMTLPLGLLADGAVICESDGSPIELGDDLTSAVDAVRTAKEAVIDLRNLGEARPWYDATFRLLSQRLGVDADRQTVAIEPRAYASLGGVPVDEEGRAVIGAWSRWFTGLYAAGGTACTGLHGAGLLPGNLVLDALTSGRAAGASAAAWLVNQTHGGSRAVADAVEQAEADVAAMMAPAEDEGGVVRTGAVTSAVSALIRGVFDGGTSADELATALESIEALAVSAEALHLDNQSLVANANFEAVLAAQHGVHQARAMLQSAMAAPNRVACMCATILTWTPIRCTTPWSRPTAPSTPSLCARASLATGSLRPPNRREDSRRRPTTHTHGRSDVVRAHRPRRTSVPSCGPWRRLVRLPRRLSTTTGHTLVVPERGVPRLADLRPEGAGP